MPGQPFRIEPLHPVQTYKTYGLFAPVETHSRPATCEEVDCPAWKNGWTTRLPVNSPMVQWIEAKDHGRHYIETTALGTGEREFMFPAGQACFAASKHVKPLEREPFYTVRGGDWRGSTTETRTHTRAEHWVEDFALNQQKIKETHEKGTIDG